MRLTNSTLITLAIFLAPAMWSCQQEGSNAALMRSKSDGALLGEAPMPGRSTHDTITPKLLNMYEMQIDNLNQERFGSNMDSLGGMGLYPSSRWRAMPYMHVT